MLTCRSPIGIPEVGTFGSGLNKSKGGISILRIDMTTPLRILFAEDEDSFRLSLSQFLTERGFIVESVATGENVLGLLSRREFDVIVLDYDMPGKSGLNVLQWMLEQKCEVPVIILTGAGSEHVAVEAMKLGAYDYIVKGQVDLHHVPIIINSVFERHLFRKEKEGKDRTLKIFDETRSSLKRFESAIVSLSHVANNSLAMLYLDFNGYIHDYVAPHLTPETQPHSEVALEEIKKDIDALNSTIKSMLNLASAMHNKLSRMEAGTFFQRAIPSQLDEATKEHKTWVER